MSMSGILASKGADAVFTHSLPGSYDETTDTTTAPTTTTVSGRAMEVDGDPELFKSLELIESENPTLMFKPNTAGELPRLGSSIVWGGDTYTVKNIKRLAMDGTPTAARIVIGK